MDSTRISMSCGRLRAKARTGSAELQEREIADTGIKSLKVRFNSVFGYFIEITKSNLASVPGALHAQTDDGRRRALHHARAEGNGSENSRRRRAGAAARVSAFPEPCAKRRCGSWRRSSRPPAAIATLDVICALAETARLFGYCRPQLDTTHCGSSIQGRTPSGARPESGRGKIRA